jgi:hypothetical protein
MLLLANFCYWLSILLEFWLAIWTFLRDGLLLLYFILLLGDLLGTISFALV